MQQQATSNTSGSNQTSQNMDKKTFNQNEKPKDVRKSNIIAAKGKLKIKRKLTNKFSSYLKIIFPLILLI